MRIIVESYEPGEVMRKMRKNGILPPQLEALIGTPQSFSSHPEGWSLTEIDIVSFQSRVTCPTQPNRVNQWFRFGEFNPASFTYATMAPSAGCTTAAKPIIRTSSGSFPMAGGAGGNSFSATGESCEASLAKSTPLVRQPIAATALAADEIFRVVLEIPISGMDSVMKGAVNNLEIFHGVIHSVAVLVMNMLGGFESSPQVELHQKSVEPHRPTSFLWSGRNANLVVTTASVQTKSLFANDDVFFTVDFNVFYNDFSHLNSPKKSTPNIRYFLATVGDVFTHTCFVVDEMSKILEQEGVRGEARKMFLLSAILHDVGKPATTVWNTTKNKWTAYDHDSVGVPIAQAYLNSHCLGVFEDFEQNFQKISCLVRRHMTRKETGFDKRRVRRLARNLYPATIADLLLLMRADCGGRPPRSKDLPEGIMDGLVAISKELGIFDTGVSPI